MIETSTDPQRGETWRARAGGELVTVLDLSTNYVFFREREGLNPAGNLRRRPAFAQEYERVEAAPE